jgi:spore coat polysaccharide biosynthesis protein SpsF
MAVRVGILIQCRLNSKRLPGKSLMRLGEHSLVEHTFNNAMKSRLASDCLVIIPDTSENNKLAEHLKEKSIPFFRGSESNLVSRHLIAANLNNLDVIVRIPADNPLPHHAEVDRIISHHIAHNMFGFSSNLTEIFNSGYPDGIGAEVFSTELIHKIDQKLALAEDLEHVHLSFFNYATQNVRRSDIKVSTVKCPPEFARPDIRLDINTQKDFEYFEDMFYFFQDNFFDINDIIKWHDSINLAKYRE